MTSVHDEEVADPAAVEAWAASGAMALTGPADGPPLGPPAPLVHRLRAAAELLTRRSGELGREVAVDPLRLLSERAAIAGFRRRGQVSCGGGTRLLPAADGWLALSLARPEDVELVPAWLGVDPLPEPAVWDVVAEVVRTRPLSMLLEEGTRLGLPMGALPHTASASRSQDAGTGPPGQRTLVADLAPLTSLDGVVVVDLSSLWAGPLCGSLLGRAGADIIKVESLQRPDGARHGPREFFDLLNAGKRSVAFDFASDAGRTGLRKLVARADVVIEGSRPRALRQLGIDAEAMLSAGRSRVWLSITGHGRTGAAADRTGFGDDAAVDGGLVAWDDNQPYFCADAVADPTSGLVAGALTLDALATGGRWLLDVSLSGVAAHLAGPTMPVPAGTSATAPSARRPSDAGPELGADTAGVLDELGIDP